MLEFILMILVVELGIGLYLYSEAHAPKKVTQELDSKMWFEDIPPRLRAKRVTHAKKATTSKKPVKGEKAAPSKVWSKTARLPKFKDPIIKAKATDNKQTKKASRQVAQPRRKTAVRRKG